MIFQKKEKQEKKCPPSSKMKILCISDNITPVIYSNKIKSRFSDVELVLSAGDINLEYYEFIVSMLNKPLLFVFGNHNLKYYSYYKKDFFRSINEINKVSINSYDNGGVYISGKVKKVKGLIIAGLGGSKRYNKGANQFTETGMFFYILRIIPKLFLNKIIYGRYLDILLTHTPPKGINDGKDICHSGFKIFLWFLKIFKPKYLVHGHIHMLDLNKNRISYYLKTKIINAYEYVVINTEE